MHYNATTMSISYTQYASLVLVVSLIGGCSGKGLLNVYRSPVEQGNLYEQKHIDQLQIGMSKEQVTYIIGKPMLQDPFNPSRWDYYYSFANRRKEIVKRHHLTLRFDGNTLVDIEEVVPLPFGTRSRRAETDHESRKRADDELLLDQQ